MRKLVKGVRFSKAKLLDDLREMAERRRKLHGFDPGNGYAQVRGKGEEANREYGEWRTILDIINWIDSSSIGV